VYNILSTVKLLMVAIPPNAQQGAMFRQCTVQMRSDINGTYEWSARVLDIEDFSRINESC